MLEALAAAERVSVSNLYYLISHGGCGTHAYLDLMYKCGKARPPGWKSHRRDPNIEITTPGRMVYLYGDPYDAMLSFDRRGFFEHESHCRNISGDAAGMGRLRDKSLLGFLRNGIEYFDIANHVRGWMNYSARSYDIMFVKYERLAYLIPDILDYLDIPSECQKHFQWVPRQSKWQNASPEIQQRLESMFGEYREWWMGLDDKILLHRS